MSTAELIERQTALIKAQADIINALALTVEQLGAATELDDAIEAAAKERQDIIGE